MYSESEDTPIRKSGYGVKGPMASSTRIKTPETPKSVKWSNQADEVHEIDQIEDYEDEDENVTEIEKLRYRISQLEHLIAMPSPIHHTTSTSTYNYAAISVHPGLPGGCPSPSGIANISNSLPFPMPTSVQLQHPDISAITPNDMTISLSYRIDQLETLLAESEIDNRNLNERCELIKAAKNRERMELVEEIKKRDLEIDKLQADLKLVEIQDSKNSKKLVTFENYISTLPSEEELNELQAKVDKLTDENDYMNHMLEKVKVELSKTQMEMIQKERQLQDALTKLEELKPLEEAQESLLKEFDHDPADKEAFMSSLSNETKVLNLVTLQKAKLIQSTKVIKALRTKMASRDAEKNQLIITLADKVKLNGDLEEQLVHLQIETENIIEKEHRYIALKNELEKECAELKATIDKLNNSNDSRKEQIVKLINLVTQVELCCNEVQQLVQLCQSICNGEEPSIENLVGFNCSIQNNGLDDEEIDTDCDNMNLEWIFQKLVDIFQVRKDVQGLRTKINNLYTDTLAQDVEKCNVQ